MLPILATASTILKSSASMCVLPPHASIETNLFPISRFSQQRAPPFDQTLYLAAEGCFQRSESVSYGFQSLRVERAVHLLKTSNANVEEIVAQVGYKDGGT
jgi:hypothetical protein